uniref:K Homology domain-containing protein n=1 Tax=Oryza barthii TaxID=65489 RepID=A0A0D3HF77_9ORYZ
MRQQGLNPDTVTYGTVIDVLCKSGRVEDAMLYFEQMIDEGLRPDSIIYNSLIHSLCIFDKWEKAEELFLEMLDRGICLDTIFFNSIIDSHCKEGRVIESEKLFDLMVRIGVKPDIITYSTLIDGYCLAGKMDEAMKLLSGMVSVGLKPNTVTYSTLINGYCKISRMEDALVLFKEMESSGVSPDIITYNIILQGLFQTRRTAAAKELYVRITESGTQIELSTYNIILHGLCKNKLTDDALRINDEAKDLFVAFSSNGLVPNYWTYRLMAENIIGQGLLEELDQLFLSMEDNGCTVDSGMLNFIVRELLQRGEITRAGTYLSMIHEKHFSLEASTASLFIDLLSGGKYQEYYRIFELPKHFAALKFCVGILFSYSPIRGGIFSVCVNSKTGACGQVKEVGKNASEERLIVVSSQEIPDDPVSPTIEALILLHSKVSTLAENHQLTTRLVVPSSKVGCILGEGGKVITEMRRRTGAEIRVYSKADKPKYHSFDEELVQVAGLPAIERGALTEIASRL